MKQPVNPKVTALIVVLVLAVAGWFLFKQTGPRTDGPQQPVDMSKMMGKGAVAPPPMGGTPGQPKSGN